MGEAEETVPLEGLEAVLFQVCEIFVIRGLTIDKNDARVGGFPWKFRP